MARVYSNDQSGEWTVVEEGFAWRAAMFGPIWFVNRRLHGWVLVWGIWLGLAVVSAVGVAAGEGDTGAGVGGVVLGFLYALGTLYVTGAVLSGFFANKAYARWLVKHGYKPSDIQTALIREHRTPIADVDNILHRLWVNEVPLEHGRELAKGAVRELDGRVKQLVLDHAFGRLVDEAVRTNALTEAGEKKLLAIGEAMGITLDRLESDSGLANLKAKVTIGRVNDGRLPVIDDPKILLRKGEVAHIAIDAELMKHITLREYQGGHSGFSFRVMKGVRYYIGGSKGESVVVGEDIQRVDGGVLTITSERVVFAGQRRSLEIPYGKLIGMDVWENGIRFNSSARTNVAMFTLFSGDMVAAIVNAAMQNMGEDGDKRVQTSTPRIASMGSSNPQH